MKSKENKMYECRHLKISKKNGTFVAFEWEEEKVYIYEYDGVELRKYKVPHEDFIEMMLEEMNSVQKFREKK